MSSLVAEDVMAVLDREWRGAQDVHKRVECWAFTSVRHALTGLANEKKIEARSVPCPGDHVWKWEYRRLP